MVLIQFCDMHKGFNPLDNFIVRIIEKEFGEWELSDSPEFLFFSCSGTDHYKYNNCVKVFITGEPVVANFSICDYAIAFPYMTYGDRYLKRPAWFTHTPPDRIDIPGQSSMSDDYLLNRKFCNFVYSNDTRGTAVDFRKQFAKKLMEYKQVDCPGRILNNMPSNSIAPRDGDWRAGKIDFIRDYKFTIAFENCALPGYSTEKIEDPLIAHSVPIYWGDPDVKRQYKEGSYIYVNGLENDLDAIIEKIIYLDTHDEDYLKMARMYPVISNYEEDILRVEEFIVNLIKKGNDIEDRDPLGYGRVVSVPDYRTKELLGMLGGKVKSKLFK